MRHTDKASTFRLGLMACALVLALTPAKPTAAQAKDPKSQAPPAPQVPPGVARYLRGAPPESQQFDFLIGDWTVAATRYKEDGSTLRQNQDTFPSHSEGQL